MKEVFLRPDQVTQYYPGAEVNYHNPGIVEREGKLYTETLYVVPTPKLRRVIAIVKALAITVLTFTVILWFEKTRRAIWAAPDMFEKNGLHVLSPYSESDSFETLSKKVLRGAVLKSDPLVKHLAKFTICNHTENEIIVDKNGHLYVNGRYLVNCLRAGGQFIAYSLEGFPEIICMEQKSLFCREAGKRLVMKAKDLDHLNYSLNTIASELTKISERLHQRKVFTQLLIGFEDENSPFHKGNFIKDIALIVFQKYNELIEYCEPENHFEILGEDLPMAAAIQSWNEIDISERFGMKPHI